MRGTVATMQSRADAALVAVAAVVVASVIALGAVPVAAQTSATAPGSTPGTAPSVGRTHVSVPVFSARRVPGIMRAHIADERLAVALQEIVAAAAPTSCLEVTDHGRQIFRANGDSPLEPASTNKVLTATGVLAHFGPDDKLATRAVAGAPVKDGIIDGNLWLVGGGDAMLTTAGYVQAFTEYGQTITEFAPLADRIAAAGVKEIRGDIVGDDSRYDTERYVPTWPERFKAQEAVGPLSALIVNDGVTGYSTSPDSGSKIRKAGDPPVLAAETLKTYLRDRGVTVAGSPVAGQAPPGAVEVARIESTVRHEITEMLSFSDNTTAELLNKELGLKVNSAGTTTGGLNAISTTLSAMGAPVGGLVLKDASGLDDGNRLTCDLLVSVLDKQGPDSELAAALSIWGERGTLRKQIRGTPLDGKVLAKTGTLTNPPVAALAGFEKTKAGATLTFSFVQNGLKSDAMLQARLANTLFEYPEAPDLTDLVPT